MVANIFMSVCEEIVSLVLTNISGVNGRVDTRVGRSSGFRIHEVTCGA